MKKPSNRSVRKTNRGDRDAATASAPGVPANAPSVAEVHFRARETDLLAVPPARVVSARVDAQLAAIGALTTLKELGSERRATLATLDGVIGYRADCVARVESSAWAAWYARHRLRAALGVSSEAQLDEPTRAAAAVVRQRMMKVARHNLEGDADAEARLSQIDADRGDLDLANDLVALADVYAQHEPALRGDRFYRASDVTDARSLGASIVERLAAAEVSSEVEYWRDMQNRAWTVLSADYDELYRGVTFAFWHDPRRGEWFPTLVGAVRAPARNKSREGEERGGEGTPGNGPGNPPKPSE